MITMQIIGHDRAAEIKNFDKLCFPTDFWKEEDWDDLLCDERASYVALLDDGALVGDVFLYNWQGEKDYVKIMNLAVHPDYRRQGLALRLMARAAEEMERTGMKRCCAETRASNTAMQKVFDRCGYRLDRIEEGCYENPKEDGYKYILQR